MPARRATRQYFAVLMRHIDAKFAAIDAKFADAKKDSDAKFAEAKEDRDNKFDWAMQHSDYKFAKLATRLEASHDGNKIFQAIQASASVLVAVVAFVAFVDHNHHTVEEEKRWGEYRRDSTLQWDKLKAELQAVRAELEAARGAAAKN